MRNRCGQKASQNDSIYPRGRESHKSVQDPRLWNPVQIETNDPNIKTQCPGLFMLDGQARVKMGGFWYEDCLH
jgi:hypothetical protein